MEKSYKDMTPPEVFCAIFAKSPYKPPMSPNVFVYKVNKYMGKGCRPFTLKNLETLLNGKNPDHATPALAEAMIATFSEFSIDFFNEKDAQALRNSIVVTAENQGIVEAIEWRRFNPSNQRDAVSIHEVIDVVADMEGRLDKVFEALAEEWKDPDDNPWDAEDMLEVIRERTAGQTTLDEATLETEIMKADQLVDEEMMPHIMDIAEIFNMPPKITLKFAKVANGFYNDLEYLENQIDQALEHIDQPEKAAHGLQALLWASGLTEDWLSAFLSDAENKENDVPAHIIQKWFEGKQRPAKLAHAKAVIELLVPDFLDEDFDRIDVLRTKVMKIFTGVDMEALNLDTILQEARTSPDPRKTLFDTLLGHRSPTGKSRTDLERETGMSEHQIKKRITGATNANEKFAHALANMFFADEQQREIITEIVTGVASPSKLMAQVDDPENDLTFPKAIMQIRQRKGLTGEELAERVGVSGTVIFKLEHGEPVEKKTVHALADLLFPAHECGSKAYYHFICHAMGIKPQTPEEIVEDRQSKKLNRAEATQKLIKLNPKDFREFSSELSALLKRSGRGTRPEDFREAVLYDLSCVLGLIESDIEEIEPIITSGLDHVNDPETRSKALIKLSRLTGLSDFELGLLFQAREISCRISLPSIKHWLTGESKPLQKQNASIMARILLPDNEEPLIKLGGLRTKLSKILLGRQKVDLQNLLDQAMAMHRKAVDPNKQDDSRQTPEDPEQKPVDARKFLMDELFGIKGRTGMSRIDIGKALDMNLPQIVSRIDGFVHFDEDEAASIGKVLNATPEQIEQIATILTGIDPPAILMEQVLDPDHDMSFSKAVFQMRSRKRWKQHDIAEKMGSSVFVPQKLEKGQAISNPYGALFADIYFPEKPRSKAYYHCLCHAVGLEPKTLEQILEERKTGDISREMASVYLAQFGLFPAIPKKMEITDALDELATPELKAAFDQASAVLPKELEYLETLVGEIKQGMGKEDLKDVFYELLAEAGLSGGLATKLLNYKGHTVSQAAISNWLASRAVSDSPAIISDLSKIMVPDAANDNDQPRAMTIRNSVNQALEGGIRFE